MKIWCEKCKGKRKIVISDSLGLGFKERINCDLCDGKGYTENETIEHEAEVGRACIDAFENGATIEGYNVECYTLEQLLEWHRESEEK